MPSQKDKKIDLPMSGTSMERAKRLLDKMTIEEKTMQLVIPVQQVSQDVESCFYDPVIPRQVRIQKTLN